MPVKNDSGIDALTSEKRRQVVHEECKISCPLEDLYI